MTLKFFLFFLYTLEMMQLNMNPDLCWSKTQLDEIADLICKNHGRDIRSFAQTFLVKSLEKRLVATSIDNAAAYALRLAEDKAEAEALIHSLHVGFSEFFRDPLVFALLGQVILPELVGEKDKIGRAEIRIWSAGCASGQEAFSVAILLDQLAAERKIAVPYRIIATDVSESELAVARRGEYAATKVKNVPLKYIESCFSRQGETYRVVERIRARVDFSTYDLLDKHSISPPVSIFGDFDLVLCSNLLFYYRPAICQAILAKIHRCLSPKGYLATGETERAIVEKSGGFRVVAPPAAVYRKT